MSKHDKEYQICVVDGCEKPGKNRRGMCHYCYATEMKESRRKRIEAGLLEPRTVPRKLSYYGGYLQGYAPEHPLSTNSGSVFEHRRVAYDKYGPGTQKCHWCETPLEWKQVDVDHLDWNRANNHPDNLVTSCASCNRGRLSPKEEETAQKASEKVATAKNTMMALVNRLNR